MDNKIHDITIGLFGTHNSSWRVNIMGEFKKLGENLFTYFTSVGAISKDIFSNLSTNDIVVYVITDEDYGYANMAEVGILAAQIVQDSVLYNRYAIIYISATIDIAGSNTEMAEMSISARALLRDHFQQFTHKNIIILEDLNELIHVILNVAGVIEQQQKLDERWAQE